MAHSMGFCLHGCFSSVCSPLPTSAAFWVSCPPFSSCLCTMGGTMGLVGMGTQMRMEMVYPEGRKRKGKESSQRCRLKVNHLEPCLACHLWRWVSFWDCSPIHSFVYCHEAELSSCHGDRWLHKRDIYTVWSFGGEKKSSNPLQKTMVPFVRTGLILLP